MLHKTANFDQTQYPPDPDPSANSPAREAAARNQWRRLWQLLLAPEELLSRSDEETTGSTAKIKVVASDTHSSVSIATTLNGPARSQAPEALAHLKGRAANGC